MVNDFGDNKRRNPLLPQYRLLFSIGNNGFYMHHPTDKIAHSTAFVIPITEYWLEQIISSRYDIGYYIVKIYINIPDIPRAKPTWVIAYPRHTHIYIHTEIWVKLLYIHYQIQGTIPKTLTTYLNISFISLDDITYLNIYLIMSLDDTT